MMPLLIGLGFRARQGKDSAARAIIEARGGPVDIRRYAFADELKREYTEACHEAGTAYALIETMRVTHNLPPWVQYELGADMSDPLCPYGKQRTLLQFWGSEYRRAKDPYYWIKKLHQRIKEESPKVALITDMRFPNEAMYVKFNRGYTVEVRRSGFTDLMADSHHSEHALATWPFDITLEADSVESLHKDAVDVYDMIVGWITVRGFEEEAHAGTLQGA